MFAVCGIRSLYTAARFPRLCRLLSQKFPSSTHKEFNNLYSATWPPGRPAKQTSKFVNLYLFNPPANDYSTKQSDPLRNKIPLNKTILSLKTVEEQLHLFESTKASAGLVKRVIILYNIAKITEQDENQKQFLEQQREKVKQKESSEYVELLESISRDISKCQPRDLANMMWALGKIREKDHMLVEVCEKEILSRDIVAFDNAGICQIANGCATLNMKISDIFRNIEEGILNGQVKIQGFENRELSGILLSFSKTGNGSDELFLVFLNEILSRDFLGIDCRQLAGFVWSFAKKKFKADMLFEHVEEEILRRGTTDFHNSELIQLLWAFATAEKGSKQLFYLLDNELVARGVEKFDNAPLSEIVWSFNKKIVREAKVFDLVKKEALSHGVHKFKSHELVLILLSFVSAQRHDDMLVAEIQAELCLRDVKQFRNGHLCQVAWSLGRAEKSDSKMFDVIEAEVFQRGVSEFSMKQKRMVMRGFIDANRGSNKFYELLVRSFSPNDLFNLNRVAICECVWCFANAAVEAGELFDALEKEILSKGRNYFNAKELTIIKGSFKQVGRGGAALFGL